ncbi:MAG: CapA family protein [Bacteroidota bacterium]
MLGDVMVGRDVHPSAETFAYLEPALEGADLVTGNLESPLTRARVQVASAYVLCAPPENAHYLAQAHFDLLTLANNHHLDCGVEGLLETRSVLTKAGIEAVGPDPQPVERTVNGLRLAFLAFDATQGFDLEAASSAVHSAYAQGAIVVVSMHWGVEYQGGASAAQERMAAQLAASGAALIWGHHPHVLQPAAWLNGGRTLVLYSLGNALFDQYGLASTRQSVLALVEVGKSGAVKLNVIPFVIDVRHSVIRAPDAQQSAAILQFFAEASARAP